MAASGQSSAVKGKVSITASDVMAVGFLPDALQKLHQIAPKIDVEIVASNRLEDLTRRSADIAIRHVRPEHPDLIAKQMRDFTAGFYASKDYVAEYGLPQKAHDLEGHAFIGPRDTVQMSEMLQEQGIIIAENQYRTMTDSGVVMWEMMRAGLGIALLPGQLWPPSDEVMPVLTDLPPMQFPIWLVTHRELKTSGRIRVVFDALADAFATTDKAKP